MIRKVVEAYGFVNVRVFGSTCSDDDVDGSDLDLLVTIPADQQGRIPLFDIMEFESGLEEMPGVTVDLNVANNMPEHLKADVGRSAIPL